MSFSSFFLLYTIEYASRALKEVWLVDEFDRPLGLVLEVVNFSISPERVLVVITPKISITFPGPMRSITAKQNHIGSVVSEILQYTQIEILLLYYKDVSESQ